MTEIFFLLFWWSGVCAIVGYHVGFCRAERRVHRALDAELATWEANRRRLLEEVRLAAGAEAMKVVDECADERLKEIAERRLSAAGFRVH